MAGNRLEEREINLIELLWKILEQWRLVFVVALIGALLLPLLIGVKSLAGGASELDDTSIYETKLESDYQIVVSALSSYMQYKSLEFSYSNSVLNQIDFADGITVTSTYEIKVMDSSQRLVTLTSAFSNIQTDEEFVKRILECYDVNNSNINSIADVVTITVDVNETETNSDAAVVIVKAILPKGIDADTWSGVLTESLNNYGKKFEDTYGKYELSLISVNSIKASAASISDKQNAMITSLNTARSAYNTTYAALSAENKAVMDQIVAGVETDNSGLYSVATARKELDKIWEAKASQTVQVVDPSIKDGFTKKYIVVGFMLGLMLYIVIACIPFVFSKRVRNAGDLDTIFSVRKFGAIYQYPYIGVISRFVHDKKVYDFHNKGLDAEKIAKDLSVKLKFENISNATFLAVGKTAENVNELISNQKKILESNGISVTEMNIDQEVVFIEDECFAKLENVFIQIISNESKFSMTYDLKAKLNEYKVNVVGVEFIEVPAK